MGSQAAEGRQALTLAEHYSRAIDVLVTDVVLPGMNGRELADRFRIARPDTKIIYTSGYTQDIIAQCSNRMVERTATGREGPPNVCPFSSWPMWNSDSTKYTAISPLNPIRALRI